MLGSGELRTPTPRLACNSKEEGEEEEEEEEEEEDEKE